MNKENKDSTDPEKITNNFGEVVSFLEKYTNIIVLSDVGEKGMVAVSPSLQGRVMTSSASGKDGRSYGWINHALFESGDTLDHMNPYGGEERFWMGPEGGQFSIFFKEGSEFILEDWQTPRLLDLEPFQVTRQTDRLAQFFKSASLKNFSGTSFQLEIKRTVEILEEDVAFERLGLNALQSVDLVAYQTTNTITNSGSTAWEKETGLISIWLLGMFNHSPNTTVVIPFVQGDESDLGPIVHDGYFGKVPADRLSIGEGVIYFKADGQYRSKIGLSPSRAKDVLGSYDSHGKILTIVQFERPKGVTDYVNSLWEIQDEPFKGDVVNSYNDGAPKPGAKPLGPFYELESSSPAGALGPGESLTHIQRTYHFEGKEAPLQTITKQVLGVNVEDIKMAF